MNEKHIQWSRSLIVILFTMLFTFQINAQMVDASGIVVDETDQPAIGASVVIKGTSTGTITGMDGEFSIKAKKGDIIEISYVGYKTVETEARPGLKIQLELETQVLDELVVIGYGAVRKKEVTGAVTKVKSDDIQKQLTSDLGSSLQGMVAGVSVASESGAPGAGSTILIRGVTSVNGGNTPLYVVDGVPQEGDPRINPNEIESLDILKDAASCAIYGTRGAAGVIMITTKTGAEGRPKIVFDAFYGVKKITSQDFLMNATEQTYFNIACKRDDLPLGQTDNNIILDLNKQPGYFHNNTNLLDAVFVDNARTQNYSATVTGGSMGINYSVVAGYSESQGSIINSGYNRLNLRANVGYTSPNKKLKANASLGLTRENTERASSSILLQAIKYVPTQPSLDGGTFESGNGESDNRIKGILDSYYSTDNQRMNNSLFNVSMNYEILKGLNLNARVAINNSNGYRNLFRPYNKIISSTGDVISKPEDSYVSQESINRESFNWDFGIQYKRKFEAHQLTLLGAMSGEEYKYEGFLAKKQGVLDNELPTLNGSSINPSAQSRANYINRLIGTIGRLQYDWKSRYLISASVRYDGSSKFDSKNHWGLFPSASAAWNVSDEAFFEPATGVINNFKIRASYGTTGNQSFNPYTFAAAIQNGIDAAIGVGEDLGLGSIQTAYANSDVKWETSKQYNFGFDLGLWRNKLTLTAEYYKTNKSDMLFPIIIPSSNGTTTPVTLNVGDMTNQGVEVAAQFRSRIGQLSYNLSATFSTNDNKITRISGDGTRISASTTGLVQGAPDQSRVTYLAEGYPAGSFFLYKTDGIINTAEELAAYQKIKPSADYGDLMYQDLNGDGLLTDSDLQYCGSGLPDYEIGFNLGLEYKGFDLYANLFAALGHEIMNGSKATAYAYGRHKDLLGAYSESNTDSPIPSYRGDIKTHPNYQGNTDLWLEDGSYLRLKTVTLGYTLPDGVLKRMKLSKLRFYVSGQNLFTLSKYSGYDPGIGGGIATRGMDIGNYPISATIMGGLNLSF